MEEARIIPLERKSRVVLDKRFVFTKDLNIGDKGSLLADMLIENFSLIADENDNDVLYAKVKILNASLISSKETRG